VTLASSTGRSATRRDVAAPTHRVHRTPPILYVAAFIPALMAALATPALASTSTTRTGVATGAVAFVVVGVIDLAVVKTLEAGGLTGLGRAIAIVVRIALSVVLALTISLAVSLTMYAHDIQAQLDATTAAAAAAAGDVVRATDPLVAELTATATETAAAAARAMTTADDRREAANQEAIGTNGARGTGEVWTELDRAATRAEAEAVTAADAATQAQTTLETHLTTLEAAAADAAQTVTAEASTGGLLARMDALETLKETRPGVRATVLRIEALTLALDLMPVSMAITFMLTHASRRDARGERMADLQQLSQIASVVEEMRAANPMAHRRMTMGRIARGTAALAAVALIAGAVVLVPTLQTSDARSATATVAEPDLPTDDTAAGAPAAQDPATTAPLVDDGTGTRAATAAGVQAAVPPDAAPSATTLAVHQVTDQSLTDGGIIDIELRAPDGSPVQIIDGNHSLFTFALAPDLPVSTTMQTRHSEFDPWEPTQSSYDPKSGQLTVAVTHLSQFTAAANPPHRSRPLSSASCDADVLVGVVRGSGQVGSGRPLHDFVAQIEEYTTETLGMTYDFFTVEYPAVDVPLILNGVTLRTFATSVDGGMYGLRGDLLAMGNAPACDDTAILIASYSQGAVATHRALAGHSNMPIADNIVSVTLFGDAARVAADPIKQYPTGVVENGLFYNFDYVLGGGHTSESWWRGRGLSVCHPGDTVCATHLSYAALDDARYALVEVSAALIAGGIRTHTSAYEHGGPYMATAVANATLLLRDWMSSRTSATTPPGGGGDSGGDTGGTTPPEDVTPPGGGGGGGGGTPPGTTPPEDRTGTLQASANGAYSNGTSVWIKATIRGLAPGQTVTLFCHDDIEARFERRQITANASGAATVNQLCYTDRPTAWVTSSSGARSATIAMPSGSNPPAPEPTDPPEPNDPPQPAQTYTAVQGSRGADTFKETANASGQGPRVAPHQSVQVACRKNDPGSTVTTNEAKTGGNWWYLLASSPWKGSYWAPSTTFMNGDTSSTPPDQWTDVDTSIPVC
jgi:hypothetical protein